VTAVVCWGATAEGKRLAARGSNRALWHGPSNSPLRSRAYGNSAAKQPWSTASRAALCAFLQVGSLIHLGHFLAVALLRLASVGSFHQLL